VLELDIGGIPFKEWANPDLGSGQRLLEKWKTQSSITLADFQNAFRNQSDAVANIMEIAKRNGQEAPNFHGYPADHDYKSLLEPLLQAASIDVERAERHLNLITDAFVAP